MFYLVRTPLWLKKVYPTHVWDITTKRNELFLSFDDGPHPIHTGFVLDELKKYNAKATFFCIGKNVLAYPEMYKRIIEEGHAVGNHTFNHLNGWKTRDDLYFEDIDLAAKYIDSNLFRPPYGRISLFQVKQLIKSRYNLNTIMWTVLSGDFDAGITPERCLQNVLLHAKKGSIIVFHDNEKAAERMKFALPLVLGFFAEKGFQFKEIKR